MPLPRPLAHPKLEIMDKKWAEARQWVGGWTSKKKYNIFLRTIACTELSGEDHARRM